MEFAHHHGSLKGSGHKNAHLATLTSIVWFISTGALTKKKTKMFLHGADWCKNKNDIAFCDEEIKFPGHSHGRGHEKQYSP